jgi:acetaldehyde dehydrogenase/alcohol dehydrogenase
LVDQAFDDQCTGANPVYPLMEDLKNILIKAYNGDI